MTLQEALAIAAQAKPQHRPQLDKLQGGGTADQLSAGTDALNKSFDVMGGTLAKCRTQLDQIAADVEFLQNFTPGTLPRRLQS
jgi:hypothetical protein